MPALSDIRLARERIHERVVLTPVVPALALRDRLPCAAWLKLEKEIPLIKVANTRRFGAAVVPPSRNPWTRRGASSVSAG